MWKDLNTFFSCAIIIFNVRININFPAIYDHFNPCKERKSVLEYLVKWSTMLLGGFPTILPRKSLLFFSENIHRKRWKTKGTWKKRRVRVKGYAACLREQLGRKIFGVLVLSLLTYQRKWTRELRCVSVFPWLFLRCHSLLHYGFKDVPICMLLWIHVMLNIHVYVCQLFILINMHSHAFSINYFCPISWILGGVLSQSSLLFLP